MADPVLTLEAAGLRQGSGWLFEGLDLTIDARDRLALIGRNGAGKSTLLKLIEGSLALDSGRRAAANGLTIGRLEQDPPMTGHYSLRDYALAGGAAPHEVAAIADQLGLDLDRAVTTASGGERRRAALARLLADRPQLLLLDEPTNHLDINAIEWLENWLDRAGCALVVISHDRAFLTRLTRNMLWLDRGRLRRAEVGFGGFDAWAEQVAAEDERNAQRLATKLRAEEHWLQRGVTARRKRNMGRLGKLMELRAERRAMSGPEGVARLAVAADDRQTKVLVDVEHVAKAFGERHVISDLSLRVRRGDRIGIIGPNGAGKSTLLKLLLGQLAPDSGSIRRAPNLDAIIIDQHRTRLAPGATVRDVLADGGEWLDVRGAKTHLAGYLKDYLFDPGVIDAPVASFSGGEQARLLLARELARPATLMVLDEPTNDLDMDTLDLLEEVLADYPGTVLLVSHDRAFLDRVVTQVVALDGQGGTQVVVGGWSDWARQARPAPAPKSKQPARPVADAPKKASKLSYKDARELAGLPAVMEKLTASISAGEARLADPDFYARDPAGFQALTARLDALRAELETAELRWLELSELEEALAG
jgi:ATP-binding cassette subfamily F protein uup